jgi:hypothetical protein
MQLYFYINFRVSTKISDYWLHCMCPFPVKKTELTAERIHCADHATPSIRKSWH